MAESESQSGLWSHHDQTEIMGVSVADKPLAMPDSLKMRYHESTRDGRSSNGNFSSVDIEGPRNIMETEAGQTADDTKLPQLFTVKYLGKREARGLWGIKNTRKPVDEMVNMAKNLKAGTQLPYIELKISDDGVTLSDLPGNVNKNFIAGLYPIDTISYGVQDVVYTRVFAMIVVCETAAAGAALRDGRYPFECHAFVCDSRNNARRLTFALATAFQVFSRNSALKGDKLKPKKFAIDLRPPEVIASDLQSVEDDSEA